MKQALFLSLFFLVLALLQTSFLAHFSIQGFSIPMVLVAIFIVSMFSSAYVGLWGAFAGGLVLDVFSQHLFGYWTITLVVLSFAVSFIMHTYVRFPLLKRN